MRIQKENNTKTNTSWRSDRLGLLGSKEQVSTSGSTENHHQTIVNTTALFMGIEYVVIVDVFSHSVTAKNFWQGFPFGSNICWGQSSTFPSRNCIFGLNQQQKKAYFSLICKRKYLNICSSVLFIELPTKGVVQQYSLIGVAMDARLLLRIPYFSYSNTFVEHMPNVIIQMIHV